MYILACEIVIGGYTFSRCTQVEIDKSIDLVANTARIVMPATAVLVTRGEKTTIETAKLVQKGMPVTIKLWYEGYGNQVEFVGYVKVVNYKIPLEIECEDIYMLRKKNINKAWQSVAIRDVLAEIVSGTGIELSDELPDITLAPYSIKNASGAFALQKIRDDFGLSVYVDESNKLMAELAYSRNTGEVKYYLNGENVNVINADDLKFHNKDDVKLKIKAIGISGSNARTEVEVGDDDGELKTLHFYNITSAAELQKIALQEMSKLKFDGYQGKLTTFLLPNALPGMTAILVDDMFPERSGRYYIESVKTTWGVEGSRREVEIGIKLNG